MPSTIYTRRDQALRLAAAGAMAEVQLTTPEGVVTRTTIPRNVVDRAAHGDEADLSATLAPWLAAASGPFSWTVDFQRVTVDVGEREWAAIAFESFLPPGGWLVRTSPVYPRVLQIPLAFPIRILETGAAMVRTAIEQTFQGTFREHAFVDAHTTLGGVDGFLSTAGWPTLEILQIHDLVDDPFLLSTARGSPAGSAGWFLRLAGRFQTRLIVIEAAGTDMPRLRVLAQGIMERGGPAVWLVDRAFGAHAQLYGDIAHDRPLDWIRVSLGGELFAGAGAEEALRYSAIGTRLSRPDIVQSLADTVRRTMLARRRIVPAPPTAAVVTLILGAAQTLRIPVEGETIRYQVLWGTRAERFADDISTRLTLQGLTIPRLDLHGNAVRDQGADLTVAALAQHVQTYARPLARMTRQGATEVFSSKLLRIGETMQTYEFESHESEGMLPLAAKVVDARRSEERRVGKECMVQCRSRWSPYH